MSHNVFFSGSIPRSFKYAAAVPKIGSFSVAKFEGSSIAPVFSVNFVIVPPPFAPMYLRRMSQALWIGYRQVQVLWHRMAV